MFVAEASSRLTSSTLRTTGRRGGSRTDTTASARLGELRAPGLWWCKHRDRRGAIGELRPWPPSKQASKEQGRSKGRQRRHEQARGQERARTFTSQFAGTVALCGGSDRSSRSNGGSGCKGKSQWQ